MTQLKADADEVLETLRDLARGIYPPLLADKGLVVALESQARKAPCHRSPSMRKTWSAIHRTSRRPCTSVSSKRCRTSRNMRGHRHVMVRLRGSAGALTFEVADDGSGFDTTTVKPGAGLTNMVDRVEALGGTVEVVSQPGAGAHTFAVTFPHRCARLSSPDLGLCGSRRGGPRFRQPVGTEIGFGDEPGRARLGRPRRVLVGLIGGQDEHHDRPGLPRRRRGSAGLRRAR